MAVLDICENTLGPTFWQSEMRHRGAYQKDEFTARSAELEKGAPETRKGSYGGSHMQHIYTVQQGGLDQTAGQQMQL